jgi:3-deoxy-D-manno-octulosonate 8-phosphate phosphatase (KDO 8-P phosphatase)
VPDPPKIRAIVADVDGVLTDGAIYLGGAGEEIKRVAFLDIMGLSLARKAGMRLAMISGEEGATLNALAKKLQIVDVYSGCKDKASALRDFASKSGVPLEEICYMGDDVNDVPAMRIAGLAAAPAGAHGAARREAGFVATLAGGNGAIRELVDFLLGAP